MLEQWYKKMRKRYVKGSFRFELQLTRDDFRLHFDRVFKITHFMTISSFFFLKIIKRLLFHVWFDKLILIISFNYNYKGNDAFYLLSCASRINDKNSYIKCAIL